MREGLTAQSYADRAKPGQRFRVVKPRHSALKEGDIITVRKAMDGRIYITTPSGRDTSISSTRIEPVGVVNKRLLLLC